MIKINHATSRSQTILDMAWDPGTRLLHQPSDDLVLCEVYTEICKIP